MLHPLRLFVVLFALAAAAAGQTARPAATSLAQEVERHLAAIEWALEALRNHPGDTRIAERAERSMRESTAAIRRLVAGPAQEAPRDTPEVGIPEGAWIQPALVGARGPFQHVLVTDWGWNPLEQNWLTLESADLSGRERGVGIVSSHYEGTHGAPLAWTDVLVRGALDESGQPRSRWGLIVFDVEGWSFSQCTFRDIPDEHGIYATTLGGLRFERCLFENIGSQAIQIVGAVPGTPRAEQTAHQTDWREYSAARAAETHSIVECVFLEVGQPTGGRPSFAISAFEGPRNPVRIERCVLRTRASAHPDGGGVTRDSFGAVMAHQRSRFELLDTYIEYLDGDRDVIQVWNCSDGVAGTPDVVLRGNRVLAGQWVDIRVQPGDTVVIEGNAGSTARVRISSNPPDVWPHQASWDPARVLHEGALADDYRLD